MVRASMIGGTIMTTLAFASDARRAVPLAGAIADKVRTLIADCLYVDLESVTDDARFVDDLGADSLDCLELMTLIEGRFTGVEISDDDFDRMVAVGDLIRHIERAGYRVNSA
jgi:acyl carrier protein